MNNIKQELEKIEIPKELNNRVALGVKQAKIEGKKKRRYPKWILGSVASIMVIGAGFTFGGSYIADATDTLIGQIFGSKEELKELLEPFSNEGENLPEIERHLELVKEQLTEAEFTDYKKLIKEKAEILNKMGLENRQTPNIEEEKRLEELRTGLKKYEKRVAALTTHTLEEAQRMVDYPINPPSYVPKRHELKSVEASTEEMNIGIDPIVEFHYLDDSRGLGFSTTTQKIDQNKKGKLESLNYDHIDSYTLNGFKFEFATYDDSNIQGMRITIPEEGYEITMSADILLKEEMEKILLSMVK
ncbi:hypothetical protein ACSVDA_04150 [Cytobacillus sp. Hm23]